MRDYRKMYIDGAWVDSAGGQPLDVINPATEAVAGVITNGSAEDVDRAVRAARRAFVSWSRSSRAERIELLSFVGATDGSRIAAELHTTLLALRDWPDMPTGPMRTGDTRQRVSFAMYDIAEGGFDRDLATPKKTKTPVTA